MDPTSEPKTGEPQTSSHLDWTHIAPQEKEEGQQLGYGREYDSRPHEDKARRRIAYLLISLLWAMILAILVLLCFKVIKVEEIKEFSVMLGPVVTLVSAATGFYYGTKSK